MWGRNARRLALEPLESRHLCAALTVPALSSRPQAAASLYLDFDGHFERQWGSHTNVSTPAYDTDGQAASFSSRELAAIREIWARVAEDYAPFNINVTTVAPRVIADRVAARVAIGGSYSDWYGRQAGGVAFVGGFAGGASNVAYIFATTLSGGEPRYVAEAASHEAGHLFGLDHQAQWNGGQLVEEYASGTAALAPIMGASYYAARTTWANGPTTAGPAARQDALSILAAPTNGFGYVPDDYGSTLATAAVLPMAGGSVNVAGLIGRNGDRDVFKFTTGGGSANFTLAVAPFGPNLDGVLELQSAAGQTIAIASPADSLGASLKATLSAGTYYLVARASGGYGNLGRYTLQGTIAAQAAVPAPPPTIPQPSDDLPEGEGPAILPPAAAGVRVIDDGGSGHARTGTWQHVATAGYAGDTSWAPASGNSAATWTFAGLAPGQYRVAASWTGSRLNATDAPFTITSGGKTLGAARVNQQRSASTFTSSGAAWQSLGTFAVTGNSLVVRLNTSTSGRVVADAVRLERVYATAGGSAFHQAAGPSASELAIYLAAAPHASTRRPQPLIPAAADAVFAANAAHHPRIA